MSSSSSSFASIPLDSNFSYIGNDQVFGASRTDTVGSRQRNVSQRESGQQMNVFGGNLTYFTKNKTKVEVKPGAVNPADGTKRISIVITQEFKSNATESGNQGAVSVSIENQSIQTVCGKQVGMKDNILFVDGKKVDGDWNN